MTKARLWWERNFLKHELIASMVLTVAVVLAVEMSRYYNLEIYSFFRKVGVVRHEVYKILATVSAPLLGFTITTMSITLSQTRKEKFRAVKQLSSYQDIWSTFKAAIRWFSVLMVACIIALIVDTKEMNCPRIVYLVLFALSVTVFRFARCVWIIEKIVAVVVKSEGRMSVKQSDELKHRVGKNSSE